MDSSPSRSVVGPAVPEGAFPVPATTPCTFTITLAGSTGHVALDLENFSVVDERNETHVLALARGSADPPTEVAGRATIAFRLTAILPTGNGELVWAPAGKAIASWDFDVEID